MNQTILELIDQTLEAWRLKAQATKPADVDTGPEACPLCRAFRAKSDEEGCWCCPVRAVTGRGGCHGTPIYRVDEALAEWKASESERRRQRFISACQVEIRFLEQVKQHVILNHE